MVSVSPSKCDHFPFSIKLHGAETESGDLNRSRELYYDSFELLQGALDAKGYSVNAAASRAQVKADDIVKLITPGPLSAKKKLICKALKVLLPDNEMNKSCNDENLSIVNIESPISQGSFTHSSPTNTKILKPLLDMTNTSTPKKTKVTHNLNDESVTKMIDNMPYLNEIDSSFELSKELIADKDTDLSFDADDITVPVTNGLNAETSKNKLSEDILRSTPSRVIFDKVEFEEKYLNEIEPNSKKYCVKSDKSNESDFKFQYLKETSNDYTQVSTVPNLSSADEVILNFDNSVATDLVCNDYNVKEKKASKKRKCKEHKRKKNKSSKREEIKMKIKWKHKEFQFKISGLGAKDRKKSGNHTRILSHPDKKIKVKNIIQKSKHLNASKDTSTVKKAFKQATLAFSINDSSIQYLEQDEIPKKRSKIHRSPTTNDGLKQMSISSFLIKK